MNVKEIPLQTLEGEPTSLGEFSGRALLVVNVASKCGFTPQYAGLEKLQQTYGDRGFAVVGVPCNQFGGQEPGSAEQIRDFCSTTYDVTFPMMAKAEVNGAGRHPLYELLTQQADADGEAGDVQWNFEKFLIAPDGTVTGRFRSAVEPGSEQLTQAIEAVLPQ